ncbi:MAG: hypothetical protein P8Z49_08985 [Acidobacteriota bacterium]
MFLSRVRWGLEYLAVACLRLFLAPMPSSLRVTFGMGLGWLAYRVDKRHRNVALDNLKVSYPDKDEAWRRRTARMAFQNLGRLLVEIPFQKAKVRRRLESTRIEGWEYLQEASQQGRGYFLVSGHFGNWEWIAHLQGALGHPLWMITRPMDNPYLESFTAKRRECTEFHHRPELRGAQQDFRPLLYPPGGDHAHARQNRRPHERAGYSRVRLSRGKERLPRGLRTARDRSPGRRSARRFGQSHRRSDQAARSRRA